MEKVSFKQMKDGTKEDYLLLEKHEKKFIEGTAQRILKFMSNLNHTLEGYQVSRLEHSLQTATRALNEKANDEMKKLGKEGLSEDLVRGAEESVQELTNTYAAKINVIYTAYD